jgi:hypothetical protein
MAKTKISEFSTTAADNTDITNINIAEGCSPANVNNAIRSLMSVLKNQQDGSSGDSFTVAGTLVSSGTVDITGAFRLDGTAGASGQALVSAGGANTPTWSALGTMASQSASAVAITGGTITGITDLTVADGGTGASSITANSVILGNGSSALSGNLVAPSTSGNILTSNGTTWTSAAAPTGITATTGSSPYYGARAWVNFNGTGTPAIRASGNVTSITDNDTGLYTINFTTAMPDTSYTTVGSSIGSTTSADGMILTGTAGGAAPTTSAVQVRMSYAPNNSATDITYVNVAVFR